MESADNLIRILLQLRNQADSKQQIATYTWDQVSNMLRNVSGIHMDYETFKAQYDSIPQLSKVVDRFDAQGLTLKTKEKPTDTKGQGGQNNIISTAKRAATKTLQQPG